MAAVYDPLSQPKFQPDASDDYLVEQSQRELCKPKTNYYCLSEGLRCPMPVLGKDIFRISCPFPVNLIDGCPPLIKEVLFESEPPCFEIGEKTVLILAPFTYGQVYDLSLESSYIKLGYRERENLDTTPVDIRFLQEAHHYFYGVIVFRKSQATTAATSSLAPFEDTVVERLLNLRRQSRGPKPVKKSQVLRNLINCTAQSFRYVILGALMTECFEMIELIAEEIDHDKVRAAMVIPPTFLDRVRPRLASSPRMIKFLCVKACHHSIGTYSSSPSQPAYQMIFSAIWSPCMVPQFVISAVEKELYEELDYLYWICNQTLRVMTGKTREPSSPQTMALSIAVSEWLLNLHRKNQHELVPLVQEWARNYLVVTHYHPETITIALSLGYYHHLQDTICQTC